MNEINDYDIAKSQDKSNWKETTSDLRYHQKSLYIEDQPCFKRGTELYTNDITLTANGKDVPLTTNGKCWNGPVNENMMETEPAYNVRGLLVFTINVGQLSIENAQEFIETYKDHDLIEELRSDNIRCIFIPVRTSDTKVEYIKF
jgi:hypothetical protein